MRVDPTRCQWTRLKKIWTDSEKNWTLFNIHTSDKLEIFFGGRVFSAAKDPFCLPRRKWRKPSALVSGINLENGVYPMGERHECCVYKPLSERLSERASE